MSKMWIDLTDIQYWQGQHGGVQRVVYGIASNYFLNDKTNGKNLGFFAFDSKRKLFHEVDFEPIYERVEQARLQTLVAQPVSIEEHLKRKYRKYLPSRLVEFEPGRKVAKKIGHKTITAAKRSKRLLMSVAGQRQRNKTIVFDSNDTVLILGKPWDNPDIQKTLTWIKRETGFRLVQVVYDLIIPLYPHLHHSSLFKKYTQHMFEVVASSDLLLPISKSSNDDLRVFSEMLCLEMPKTKIIRLGDDIVGGVRTQDKRPDSRVEDGFILSVGTIEIRKNHTLLYYAYKLAEERGIELPQLVIVGSNGWLSHDIQYLIKSDPNIRGRILILKNVSDAGLDWLYRNCRFTVYPSMYEGWGLPVAESLAYGKLCISSGTSSMPEIAGDILEYFSPYDASACLGLIIKYLDEGNRERTEQKIATDYRNTNWQSTYLNIKKLLD